eukprot:97682-Chlamydomonas_euryale.AAC.1
MPRSHVLPPPTSVLHTAAPSTCAPHMRFAHSRLINVRPPTSVLRTAAPSMHPLPHTHAPTLHTADLSDELPHTHAHTVHFPHSRPADARSPAPALHRPRVERPPFTAQQLRSVCAVRSFEVQRLLQVWACGRPGVGGGERQYIGGRTAVALEAAPL